MRSLLKSKSFPSYSTLKELSLAASSKSILRNQRTIEQSIYKCVRFTQASKLLQKISTRSLLTWILLLIVGVLENELYFQFGSSTKSTILRLMVGLISAYMVWLVIDYYRQLLYLKKLTKKVYRQTRIWDDSIFKNMVLEILFNIIFLPPYVNGSFRFYQLSSYNTVTLDDFFLPIYMLRFYHIVKCIHHHSVYNTQVGHFFCKLVHKTYSVQFSIKACIKDHSLKAICIGGFSISILSGILLRVFERTLPDSSLYDYWASFWVICVTQTTVGYGEYTPLSHMGRIICMFSCLFGVFLCSYLVMIFRIKSDLTTQEKKFVSQVLYRRRLNLRSASAAVILIQKWWRFMLKRKKQLPRFNEFIDLSQSCYRFKLLRISCTICKTLGLEFLIASTQSSIEKEFLQIYNYLEQFEQFKTKAKRAQCLELEIMNKTFKLHSKKDSYYDLQKSRSKNIGNNRISMKKNIDIARKRLFNNIKF